MNTNVVEQTLRDFFDYCLEIAGIVLISSDGQLISSSIGLEESQGLIIAGTLLQVLNQIVSECGWQKADEISLQAKGGYLTLLPCTQEAFIVIKTHGIPSQALKRQIEQMIRQLEGLLNPNQTQLGDPVASSGLGDRTSSAVTGIAQKRTQGTYSQIILSSSPDFIDHCQQVLIEYIGPIAPIICQRLLKQNPERSATNFIEALAKIIPSAEDRKEFREQILSWQLYQETKTRGQNVKSREVADKISTKIRMANMFPTRVQNEFHT